MTRKNSSLKYIGYGFAGGALLALLGFSASALAILSNERARAQILPPLASTSAQSAPLLFRPLGANPTANFSFQPSPTPTFTSTPTLTYNYTPTETITPSITPTISPAEQKLASGELTFAGRLPLETQLNLYNASMSFIRKTSKESKTVGEEIAGKGYGSPTLICGPLSIAILQRAGILTAPVQPIEFWLLNPFLGKDRALANRAFPEDQFEHHLIRTAIQKVDYKSLPLYPGDFLYIKHGDGGNFDHMLVINRVDLLGRAYSVTNFYTPQGFIIDEVLLYDPYDPNAGIFREWTKKKNAEEGATGFGGFELWRPSH